MNLHMATLPAENRQPPITIPGYVVPVVWTHQMLVAIDDHVPFVVVEWEGDLAFPLLKAFHN